MEELKNENVTNQPVTEESVAEQRPSTKYGRTAYQQQVQGEQAYGQPTQEQPVYGQPQQNPYQQNQQPQQNPYQQYQNPYNAYSPYEAPKPAVKNMFAYILMVLVGVTGIISFIANMMSVEAYSIGNSVEEVVDAILIIASQPAYVVLVTISDIAFWVAVVFFVLDIMQLHKAGKKIAGAILFAIFLRPAYFIWRAHLLSQKKTGPVIYTVAYYALSVIQFFMLMAGAMDMVMRTMY